MAAAGLATTACVVVGSRLSATIQAFSSSVQRRRRPTPVITSSRRKPSSLVLVVVLRVRIGAGPDCAASALDPRRRQPARKVSLRRRSDVRRQHLGTRAASRPPGAVAVLLAHGWERGLLDVGDKL